MQLITITTPAPFRFRTTLLSHGWLQLQPFYSDEPYAVLTRIVQLLDGSVVALSISNGDGQTLEVRVDRADLSPAQKKEIRDVVHWMFNLDLDLSPFYESLIGLDRYEWVAVHGGGRLLRSPTVWEDLAKTLLTTNTTWNMTRQMVGRLTELGASDGNGRHAFPDAERIASMDPAEVAEHVRAGYRNAYLYGLATAIASGKVDVESWRYDHQPSAELFKRIRSLRGFGPYAAGSMLKLLGRFDELALDSAARSMFAREFNHGEKADDDQIIRHYSPYGEWKGLVIWMDLLREWFQGKFESH